MDSSPTALALVAVAALAGMFGFVLAIVNQKRVRDNQRRRFHNGGQDADEGHERGDRQEGEHLVKPG